MNEVRAYEFLVQTASETSLATVIAGSVEAAVREIGKRPGVTTSTLLGSRGLSAERALAF